MNDLKLLKSKKVAAGIIAFMMLVVILFSVFFIAAEARHDCSGENCPICACIQQCENTLNQLGDGIVCQADVIIPAIILFAAIFFSARTFCQDTLITRKVRLNN